MHKHNADSLLFQIYMFLGGRDLVYLLILYPVASKNIKYLIQLCHMGRRTDSQSI